MPLSVMADTFPASHEVLKKAIDAAIKTRFMKQEAPWDSKRSSRPEQVHMASIGAVSG
jgi:hypothetical protein